MSSSTSPSPMSAPRRWFSGYVSAWDRFWFQPRLPHTLAGLRIVTGVMLLYSHLVLASDLSSFVGEHAWVNNETARQLHDGTFGVAELSRSYLWHLQNPLFLWLHHGVTLLVTACFAIGLMTRITAPMAWFLQLMYLHRLTGALFGFDQIVTYSTMYLMLAPCGSCLSVDAWLRRIFVGHRPQSKVLSWLFPEATPSVAANIATRLFQLHICVIYLFGGLSKARGETWWDGTAMWYSIGNYEYQSMDMTWMVNYPRIFTAMSHATLFWETFYCALIWPRRTRPLMLVGAVAVHGGIAAFLGMITFGVMMIAANMIFVRPEVVLRIISRKSAPSELLEPEWDSEQPVGQQPDIEPPQPPPSDRWRYADLQEIEERETDLEHREERLRLASMRVRTKTDKLKQREQKYRERVKRLKDREAKIKRLVERRRKAKAEKHESEQKKLPPR